MNDDRSGKGRECITGPFMNCNDSELLDFSFVDIYLNNKYLIYLDFPYWCYFVILGYNCGALHEN